MNTLKYMNIDYQLYNTNMRLYSSVADPDDFCPDPDPTLFNRLGTYPDRILAHNNFVQTISNTIFGLKITSKSGNKRRKKCAKSYTVEKT
jgi:hypothetical protein